MALLLLIPTTTRPAHADCPAAPISDPDDMAISFLAANGVQAASASLLASTVKEGIVVYDDANDTLKLCDGANWIAVGSGFGTDTLASLSCAAGEIAKFNGTAWACATDGGGGGTTGPAFSVHKNGTNQTSVANSSTVITWPTEVMDTNNNFASNRFTPTVAGRYIVTAQVRCSSSANCITQLRKNGTLLVRSGIVGNGSTSNYGGPTTAIVEMNGSTDYLDVTVFNDGTDTVSGSANDTYFMGSMIGGGSGSDTLSGLSCAANEIPKWNGTAWACAKDGGGVGGDAASYLIKGMSANQSGLASGTVVAFTTHVASAGTKITHIGNRITVAGGSRYMLRAFIRQGTAGQALDYRIFDVTNGANVPSAVASANSNSNFSDTDATAFVAPSASTTYEVRVAGGGGSALSGYSYFSAMELGGGSGGTDTLADLSCATNEIPKWNGSAWACATDGGGSGGDAASYLHASGPAKSNVAVGTVLPFDNTYGSVGADISLNTGNSRFTLKAGKTYRLMGQMVISATSPTGALWYRWYDVNGSAEIGSGGYSMTTDHTTTYSGMPLAVAYVTPSTDTDVELRISSASPATTMDVHISYAWIETIGGTGSDTLSGLSCATNEIPKWNGSAWACATDGGGSATSHAVAFSVNKGGNPQTVTGGADTGLTWSAKAFDTANAFDLGLGRFTPTAPGKYFLTLTVRCSSASIRCIGVIKKNGVSSSWSSSAGAGYTHNTAVVTALVDMNGSTDYAEASVYNDSGTSVYGETSFTHFDGFLIGGGGDALAGLSCAANEIPKWNGSAWACAADGGGASPLSGRTLATQCSYTWSANATGWRDRTWVAGDCTNGLPESGDVATGWARNGNGTAGMVSCSVSTGSHYNHPTFGATSGTVICSYFREDAGGGGSSQWSDVTDGINYAGGKVGIGNSSPFYKLDLTLDSSKYMRLSDNDSSYQLRLGDASAAANTMSPTIWAEPGGNNTRRMYLISDIPATDDSGDTSVIALLARQTGAADLTTRPVLSVQNNNNVLMTIAANGNVGIGTTSPAAKLSLAVNGATSDPTNYGNGIQITNAATGGQQLAFIRAGNKVRSFGYLPNSNTFGLGGGTPTDSSFVPSILAIDATGNVGIGTTSPLGNFHVKTATDENFLIRSISGELEVAAVNDANSVYVPLRADAAAYYLMQGNVGIGTTSPQSRLEIVNAAGGTVADNYMQITGSTANNTNYPGISLKGGSLANSYPRIAVNNGGYGLYLGGGTSGVVTDRAGMTFDSVAGTSFTFGATTAMQILPTGNVGIGPSAPNATLDVAGAIFASTDGTKLGRVTFATSVSAPTISPVWNIDGTGGKMRFFREPSLDTPGTVYMVLDDTGYLGVGVGAPGYRVDLPNTSGLGGRGRANQWTTYSDGRFKTNVETIDDALGKITALRGVSYISTTEPNAARQVGFIAQEVEKVVPEVVSVSTTSVTMPDGSTQVVDDYRSLAYDRLVPVLTEAIKELKADNDNLRAQLKAANDNNAAQDAVLEDLRVQIEALKASR